MLHSVIHTRSAQRDCKLMIVPTELSSFIDFILFLLNC